MNKKLVDSLLPLAYDELAEVGIAVEGRIPKAFRGQVSSFGAAVSFGSLLAAAAFFNEQGRAGSERQRLVKAINCMLARDPLHVTTADTLFETVRAWICEHGGSDREIKEMVLCCAVALKLAMNLYKLSPDKKPSDDDLGEGASLEPAL